MGSSFTAPMKARAPPAATPRQRRGKVTRKKARVGVSPRVLAASSSLLGTWRRALRMGPRVSARRWKARTRTRRARLP